MERLATNVGKDLWKTARLLITISQEKIDKLHEWRKKPSQGKDPFLESTTSDVYFLFTFLLYQTVIIYIFAMNMFM